MNHRPLAAGFRIILMAGAIFGSYETAAQPSRPWMNASLSPDQRADMPEERS